ncbi:streptogrisin C [Amycolatopsis arida]|uniref:Streptogrisin C n=1 Tax=Amycolatopsis arida TaxID=587909 RepID=A0A1I5XF38_9PSEU|nr:S1 family peptidase [Amycolatopsis arida]TDX97493.1 streptogrisin C [Amycolatopsis arida]SFQ30579.1 streptogrisin C [Amycolatopsis arida]
MSRRLLRLLSVAVPTAALVAAMAIPATAGSVTPETPGTDMFTAYQRDLGLTAEQARARLAGEQRAIAADQRLRAELGNRFVGSWLTDDGSRLVVAVADEADADAVRAAGAVPTVVAHDKATLDAAKAALDRNAETAPESVVSWYVDEQANALVVLAHGYAVGAAERFAADSGAPAGTVRIEATAERPRPLYDVRGGDAYYIDNRTRCSIGFSVQGGFVTAGHCGRVGSTTAGYNRATQGTFQGSSFPGNDYGWVRVNSNWTPQPVVNGYRSGGNVQVRGATEAPVNASVCRSGSTTGWHCGRITARNATVTYPQGRVSGLIRTTVCAEPGDSGGSLVTADRNNAHAQGVTSGGSGNCRSGGTTYFQPVGEILSRYNLRLLTAG